MPWRWDVRLQAHKGGVHLARMRYRGPVTGDRRSSLVAAALACLAVAGLVPLLVQVGLAGFSILDSAFVRRRPAGERA